MLSKLQEYQKAYKAKYYAANREKLIQQSIQWRIDNADRAKANFSRSYENNKERRRALSKIWIANNIDQHREYQRAYQAMRRAKIKCMVVEEIDFAAIHSRCNGKCGICDQIIDGKFEYDHILPIAHGGSHTTNNIQLSHPTCNRKKNSKRNFKIVVAA